MREACPSGDLGGSEGEEAVGSRRRAPQRGQARRVAAGDECAAEFKSSPEHDEKIAIFRNGISMLDGISIFSQRSRGEA